MRLSFGQKLTLAFAAAVAILLATAVVSYRNTRELLRTTDAVTHSQSVLATLDGIAAAMSDAEALLREDRASDLSAPRARLQQIEQAVLAHIDALRQLAEFDTLLTAGASPLDATVRSRMAEWRTIVDDTVGARAGSAAEPAAPPYRSAARESALAQLGQLRDLEGRQLRQRSAAARSGADRAEWILFVGLLLVLALAPLAFLMVRNDFRLRLDSERKLRESEARFRAAADGSLDAFYVLRAVRDGMGVVMDFEFVDLNARAETLLGHRREMVLGQRLCELIPSTRSNGYLDKYRLVLETSHVLEEEFEVEARGYDAAWIHHQVVPLDDGVAITSRDITERKQQEEALRALSLVDELTGLYNRRGFLTLAQQQLKQARRGHRELVLLFIDMDDFKEINDNFGHSEGDAALVRASQILKHTFRDSDIVARVGGDEFVVLATDTGATGSEVIIGRLRDELRERNERDGYPYRLSFSVGASRFDPDAPPSIEELMAAADHMLYAQKKQKRQAPLSAV
ncbi:MAG: diguanylate cyclase [Gemmatimonadetes bacterium]|nr:diguanylate cyclase [Gemmatimonadota bacterium]